MSVRMTARIAAPQHGPRVSLRANDADDGRFAGSIAAAVQRLLIALPTPPRAPTRAGHELEGSTTPTDHEAPPETGAAPHLEARGRARDASGVFGVLSASIDHEESAHPSSSIEAKAGPSAEKSGASPELTLPTFSLAHAAISMAAHEPAAPLPMLALAAIAPLAASTLASPTPPSVSPKKTLPGFAPPPSITSHAKPREHAHDDDAAPPSERTRHVERAASEPHHAASTHHAPIPETRATAVTATMGAVRTDVRVLPTTERSAVRVDPTLPIAAPDPDPSTPEPPAAAVHYAAIESDDAHIELAHPTLGRVDLDVHHDAGRYDVSLVTRSMGASIALRAAEESLRVDMRARSTELRAYRVRTEAGRRDPRVTNEDEEPS